MGWPMHYMHTYARHLRITNTNVFSIIRALHMKTPIVVYIPVLQKPILFNDLHFDKGKPPLLLTRPSNKNQYFPHISLLGTENPHCSLSIPSNKT